MTDYQKELAINEYLVLNTKYSQDSNGTPSKVPEAHSPYGALILGLAVCDGYSEAANILLTMAGIENYFVISQAHEWNLVKIDGDWYHLDITWNDPTPDNPGQVSYEYFNLTDEQISRADIHTPMHIIFNPKATATATKYNYYVYNNLVTTSMSDLAQRLQQDIKTKKSETTLRLYGFTVTTDDLSNILKSIGTYPDFYYKLPKSDWPYLKLIYNW